MTRLCARRRFLPVFLVVGLFAGGCTIFPRGAYWPSLEAGPADARLSEREPAPEGAAERPGESQGALRRTDLRGLQVNITRRWSNEALANSARRMSGWAGRCVYADAMRVVVWCYVEPVSYGELVVAGLESLRAALDNPTFCERFDETADAGRRERFAEALDILILKARAADLWFAFQAADWLAVAMEKNRALLGLPDGALVGEFLFGAMDHLDPYTRFLTREMLQAYRDQIEGRYTGVGVSIARRGKRVFIERVFTGGAAAGAGLRPGDEIVRVDGQAVAELSLEEVSRRLRGKAGTSVTVTVRPGGEGEPRRVVLVRGRIRLPVVRDAQMIDRKRGIGYVRLTGFRWGVERELRRAVRNLADQGAEALLLDLRDNPGGSLLSAVRVAGLLLGGGRVAQTRGRMLGATWRYDVPLLARQAWRGPVAVLVDEGTASAAEILTSALARDARATVVGRRTFGKGMVQVHLPVDWGNSAVAVTIARVCDPKGQFLEGRGVAPDVEVQKSDAPVEMLSDDPVVRAAIEALSARAREP